MSIQQDWPLGTKVRTWGWGRNGIGEVVGHTQLRLKIRYDDVTLDLVSPQFVSEAPDGVPS